MLMNCRSAGGRQSQKLLCELIDLGFILEVISDLKYTHALHIVHVIYGRKDKFNTIEPLSHDFSELRNPGALTRVRFNESSRGFIVSEQFWIVADPPFHLC